MNTLLLLGAGFSRNWGGWLADEVVDYLLAAPEVQADSPLKDLIWQHAKVGFESALEQLQQQATDNPESTAVQRRLVSFQSALERMFRELNAVFFEDPDFEFNHQIGSTVREFLARFDAIFTLNQDLLLEHHYIDHFNVALVSPRRWDAVQIPGMRRLPVNEPLYHQSAPVRSGSRCPIATTRSHRAASPTSSCTAPPIGGAAKVSVCWSWEATSPGKFRVTEYLLAMCKSFGGACCSPTHISW